MSALPACVCVAYAHSIQWASWSQRRRRIFMNISSISLPFRMQIKNVKFCKILFAVPCVPLCVWIALYEIKKVSYTHTDTQEKLFFGTFIIIILNGGKRLASFALHMQKMPRMNERTYEWRWIINLPTDLFIIPSSSLFIFCHANKTE